ncbi:hypothetical protein LAC30SC_05810 [Lactobacillus amylovorus]|uniref:Uncharacterized protein n=1 Tax=Lactobacillus amylovorus TaxID=1604 RepID=F0TF08_LACAM|nr:hypothetical protein [Lactobacillus amylovorus]ADZ07302.1 hypothetical protein LAC30SC_05810 [Lactobacillus amylovorus]MDD7407216.1 hypothetical protein [Lactobacillus amylovorus]MDY2786385.1 hypothetical protein [Lactobacillus amylovorus]
MGSFLINLLIAAFLAFFSFKNNRHEALNLFNAGVVFLVFGLVLLISAIPVFKDFDTSSVLMFTAGLLLIVGTIMLIITKAERKVKIKDIAVTLAVAAVCVIYVMRNLSFINLIVPELAMFLAIALFALNVTKS